MRFQLLIAGTISKVKRYKINKIQKQLVSEKITYIKEKYVPIFERFFDFFRLAIASLTYKKIWGIKLWIHTYYYPLLISLTHFSFCHKIHINEKRANHFEISAP